jgi:hypothetical protein
MNFVLVITKNSFCCFFNRLWEWSTYYFGFKILNLSL